MDNVIKEVTIDGANYQIVKMNSQTGSWLLMLLMGKLMDIMSNQPQQPVSSEPEKSEETTDGAAAAAISFMLMKLDEETFAKVQRKALSVCFMRDPKAQGLPVPIIMQDGRFAIKELEYEIGTIMQLTSQAIHLNLSPFFAKGKLMGLATAD